MSVIDHIKVANKAFKLNLLSSTKFHDKIDLANFGGISGERQNIQRTNMLILGAKKIFHL